MRLVEKHYLNTQNQPKVQLAWPDGKPLHFRNSSFASISNDLELAKNYLMNDTIRGMASLRQLSFLLQLTMSLWRINTMMTLWRGVAAPARYSRVQITWMTSSTQTDIRVIRYIRITSRHMCLRGREVQIDEVTLQPIGCIKKLRFGRTNKRTHQQMR